MKTAFFSFTDCGARLKDRLRSHLLDEGHKAFDLRREAGLKEQAAAAFAGADALLFVGAAGIAVRAIAPLVHSKLSDPAVIVVDELGRWVIPLLGGHIGGGNELALELAAFLGAEAVITTATDIHGVFAVDVWAVKQDLAISSLEKAKRVSAALLKGGEVPLLSDYAIEGSPPRGIVYGQDCAGGDGFGIIVSMRRLDGGTAMLQLIPRRLYVGIGCRKGVSEGAIAELFQRALEKLRLDERCVAGAASIDLKQAEVGLLNFCGNRGLACSFFDAAALGRVEGSFSASRFVQETAGVDNVCERAAVAASGGGELLLAKTVGRGVTMAAALKRVELSF